MANVVYGLYLFSLAVILVDLKDNNVNYKNAFTHGATLVLAFALGGVL